MVSKFVHVKKGEYINVHVIINRRWLDHPHACLVICGQLHMDNICPKVEKTKKDLRKVNICMWKFGAQWAQPVQKKVEMNTYQVLREQMLDRYLRAFHECRHLPMMPPACPDAGSFTACFDSVIEEHKPFGALKSQIQCTYENVVIIPVSVLKSGLV
ncbi:hypothetical protein BDR03DRAFT_987002 [Suillus americanus]|nr:hypothetical protein BDR03DRAFT_987002 [Suillus americanus]